METQPRAIRWTLALALAALLLPACSPTVVESEKRAANDSPKSSSPQASPANDQSDGGGGEEKVEPEGEIQWIDPNEIQPGPVRRENLTDEQMARIEALQKVFVEVDGQSVEQWVDSFKRDFNPDRELAVWEGMAQAYKAYCEQRDDLSLDARKEVFKVVLLRSMAPPEQVLERLDLEIITQEEAGKIMDGYPR